MYHRYSYSKTKGLFGGVSIEGSVIVERQDANAIAYQMDVTASQLLSGAVDCPEWASPLIKTLEMCTGLPGGRKWIDETNVDSRYAFGNGMESPGPGSTSPRRRSLISPPSWGRKKSSGSYFPSTPHEETLPKAVAHDTTATRSFQTQFDSDFGLIDTRPTHHPKLSLRQSPPHQSSFSPDSPFNDLPPFPVNDANRNVNDLDSTFSSMSLSKSNRRHTLSYEDNRRDSSASHARTFSDDRFARPHIAPKAELTAPLPLHEGIGRAIALFDFRAVQVS